MFRGCHEEHSLREAAGRCRPANQPPRFYNPLATIKRAGPLFLRSQDSRDFACLPDVDPNVARWSCEGVELSYGGETYRVDFVVTGTDDRTLVVNVAEGGPSPPD